MPLQTKKAVGLRDIREKIGNLQVDEKELTFGKHICAGPPRNNGTEKVVRQTLLGAFPSVTVSSY